MKKLAIVAAVVIVIAVLLITVVFSGVISRPAGNGTTPPPADVIQVPGGPKIKVIFNGPSGLEMKWQKLEADSLWQLIVSGTLKNTTSQTIIIEEVGFLLDGDQKAYWPTASYILPPGGQVEVAKGVVGVNENSKTLEVKVLRFRIVGSIQPTATPTSSPTPTQPSQAQTVFTSAPANPLTPAEVVAAFFFLCSDGYFVKAEQYVTSGFLNAVGNIESFWEAEAQGKKVAKIEIIKMLISGNNASAEGIIWFSDGTNSEGPVNFSYDGRGWKIDW